MNILIVTHHYLNGNGGGVFASRAYINSLAEIAQNVTLLYPEKEGHPIEHINKNVKAIPVPYNVPKPIKLWHVLIGLSHRYSKVFEDELIRGKYDTVVFDTSNVTWNLIDIAHKHHAKVITIHHNYQMEYDRDNSIPVLRPIILYWTKKRERESILKSDLNLTITRQDKELFIKNYDPEEKTNIEVLGCYEYQHIDEPQPKVPEKESAKSFVITGNLSAIQTEKSLIPWIHHYYPIIKERYPEATLTIAGKNPSKSFINLCKSQGINIIPSPPDMSQIILNANIYLCPTSLGGGLKLRIMDGLKNGLPVLTHAVSARGYDAFLDPGIMFKYEDGETFKEALTSVVTANYSREEIIKLYNQYFSFEAGCNRLKTLIKYKF